MIICYFVAEIVKYYTAGRSETLVRIKKSGPTPMQYK